MVHLLSLVEILHFIITNEYLRDENRVLRSASAAAIVERLRCPAVVGWEGLAGSCIGSSLN